ncbi:hypothetical protein K8942_04345 [Candidatus Peribacteria bacterium]|nr:MAG: hypothetical protein K8942_04345 [Candidatus Peribacteria bacterium]
MVNTPSEKAPSLTSSPDSLSAAPVIVAQPKSVDLTSFMEGLGQFTENANDKPANDGSGSGGTAVKTTSQTQSGLSARDLAIANLPIPVVMQKELEQHIREEVKKLRKQAKVIASMSRPGSAYKANLLYARIRRLNALLASLFEASVEVLKRLFVRVFIDKQSIQ